MDADLPLPIAILALAGAARVARPAGDRVMHHDAVAALPDVHTIAHRLDGPRGIDAQDVRERKAREVLAAPDPQAVRAVHRDRTHPQEDLAPADDRIRHVLVAEDLGRTELVHDGRLHLTKRTVASRPA